MNAGKLFLMVTAVAALAGCDTIVNPALTPQERAVLNIDVNGITIDGPSGQLARFSQVQHIPVKIGGYDIYEIYNATPNISQIKAWYLDNRLKRLELRYFNGPTERTLARAGGWQGIRDYMMEKFGPPSRFGSDVPILATSGRWNAKYAKFNGEWVFSRIKRQINYSAMADSSEGIGVVTILDTTPVVVPKMVAEPAPVAAKTTPPPSSRPPEEVVTRPANPGF